MDAALDDVFIDEISFPATDGYVLTGTLCLPRGTKRHAVLINSATAVPRKIYRGFASYLAHRGCAVLTYDYRGIGDSRLPGMVGYNQPTDDPWATRPAVELLASGFSAIKPEVLTVKPSDVGAKGIGHFGFFRPAHRDTLWRGVAEWIQGD